MFLKEVFGSGRRFLQNGPGCSKPALWKKEKNIANIDDVCKIWFRGGAWGLLTTSRCYLVSFSGKALKTPTFQHAFPSIKPAAGAIVKHHGALVDMPCGPFGQRALIAVPCGRLGQASTLRPLPCDQKMPTQHQGTSARPLNTLMNAPFLGLLLFAPKSAY